MTAPAAAWTGMRPTSSPPTSLAPPGNSHLLVAVRLAATAARRTASDHPAPVAAGGNAQRPRGEREPLCTFCWSSVWHPRGMHSGEFW